MGAHDEGGQDSTPIQGDGIQQGSPCFARISGSTPSQVYSIGQSLLDASDGSSTNGMKVEKGVGSTDVSIYPRFGPVFGSTVTTNVTGFGTDNYGCILPVAPGISSSPNYGIPGFTVTGGTARYIDTTYFPTDTYLQLTGCDVVFDSRIAGQIDYGPGVGNGSPELSYLGNYALVEDGGTTGGGGLLPTGIYHFFWGVLVENISGVSLPATLVKFYLISPDGSIKHDMTPQGDAQVNQMQYQATASTSQGFELDTTTLFGKNKLFGLRVEIFGIQGYRGVTSVAGFHFNFDAWQ